MKIEYHPQDDMLVIVFARTPYRAEGAEDTADPDVVLHYDTANRVAEIEIAHASERIDLAELRRLVSFEEKQAEPTVKAA